MIKQQHLTVTQEYDELKMPSPNFIRIPTSGFFHSQGCAVLPWNDNQDHRASKCRA